MNGRLQVSESASRILAALLEARTGQQLTTDRHWRIETALQVPMRARDIASLDTLATELAGAGNGALADEVVDALLNNETYFFRDRAPFDLLRHNVLPALREARGGQRRLSIWCAGVSTGQEAYSLAMTFADDRHLWAGWTIDILGTDVSRTAIRQARAGVYSQFEVQRGLPVLQMVRWFEPDGEEWRIAPQLKREVRFEIHSVIEPPPAARPFDIVLCRNVLLYFSAEVRQAAFARLAQAAAPDGVLMLGAGETVAGQSDRFVADPAARGLYRAAPADPVRPVAVACAG